VINIFKPCKSAGADKIVPALMQQGTEHLVAHLGHIFRASLAGGCIPEACRQVKATFIPKPRKVNTNYTKAKAYRPVNLSLFTLKMIEKLGDRHSRDEILRCIHYIKLVCLPCKSNENALHNMFTSTQNAVWRGTLGAFLKAAEQHGIGCTIYQCTGSMLSSR
jgi:hypothetical protein